MMLDVLCDVVSYGESVSEFSAEKVVYFLQRLGAKNAFNIDFIPYFYGPYSKGKVEHVLFYLNGSYIKGMSGMDKKPFISIIQSDFKIWTPRKARLFNEGGYLSVVLDYLRSSNLISYERD